MTNHQPLDPATDETSHVMIPATRSECANTVEAALWRALREARRERELLRREVCRHRAAAIQGKKPEDIAAKLQWDCFKEETDDGA